MQLSKLTISLALTGIVYGAPSLHKGGQDSTILRAHLSNTPNQASDLETRGRFADYGGLATIALVIYNAFKPTKPTKRDDHDDEVSFNFPDFSSLIKTSSHSSNWLCISLNPSWRKQTLDFTGSLESRDDVDVLPEKRLGKLTPERAVNLGTAVGL